MSAFQVKMFQVENLNDFLQHREALEGQKKITARTKFYRPRLYNLHNTYSLFTYVKKLGLYTHLMFLTSEATLSLDLQKKMSYDYKHLMGNLILTTSP